jgi:hypothetical protein
LIAEFDISVVLLSSSLVRIDEATPVKSVFQQVNPLVQGTGKSPSADDEFLHVRCGCYEKRGEGEIAGVDRR